MSEWQVVGVIVVLIGLFFTIYTPISKSTKENTKVMSELNLSVKMLTEQFSKFENGNHDDHKRIWDHNDEQDAKIQDHEVRISIIEKRDNK